MKDGQEGVELHGQLVRVDVGHGKTSCVIVEAAAPETANPNEEGQGGGDAAGSLLVELNGLSADMWQKPGDA